MKDRTIQNNLLFVHELVKNYKKRGGPKCCAININIMKAFDTVSWPYLMMILQRMNLPQQYLNCIRICISAASFSINMNSALNGNFRFSRGLRQENCLLRSLFILIIEGSIQILKIKIFNSSFRYHPKCEHLILSSLAFVDDLFILSKANTVCATNGTVREQFGSYSIRVCSLILVQ